MKLFSNSGKRDVTQKTTQDAMGPQDTPQGSPQDTPQDSLPSNPQNAPQGSLPSDPQDTPQDNTVQAPFEIVYPEVEWSEEQKRVLQMATQPGPGDEAPIPEKAVKQSFEHLAPPKKSVIKIILLILLITVLVSATGFGGWYYWWTTYATFDFDLQPVVILNNESVSPDDFLSDASKAEGVKAVFQNPDFISVPGRISVPLTLELGWRSLETTAVLFVLLPHTSLTCEFRAEIDPIDPLDLLSNAEIARGVYFDFGFTEEPEPVASYEVGEYTLSLTLNGAAFTVTLIISDTTAPTATPVPVIINIGEAVSPEDFVTDIYDASEIESISFVSEPDVLSHREQLVEVIITDIYGNYAAFPSSLSIILNMFPPTFEGIALIESMVGKEVNYGLGVTATDSFGRELEFVYDDSEVDINEEGEYTALYIVHDLTGQITTEEFTVLIISVEPEDVINQANDILEDILDDEMTTEEKIHAIFNYIRGFLTVNDSEDEPASIFEAAHTALDTKRGNSYNYSALAQVLLTQAEIPNMRIFRSGDHPSHVWNIVSPNGDNWYHFDSMPTAVRDINALMFMFTQEQADDFAQKLAARDTDPMYYNFNSEYYPDIVKQ